MLATEQYLPFSIVTGKFKFAAIKRSKLFTMKVLPLETPMTPDISYIQRLKTANVKLKRQLSTVCNKLEHSRKNERLLQEHVTRLGRHLLMEAMNRKYVQATFADWQVMMGERLRDFEAQEDKNSKEVEGAREELIATKQQLENAEKSIILLEATIADGMAIIDTQAKEIATLKRDLITALKSEEQAHSEHLAMAKDFERKTTTLQADIRKLKAETTMLRNQRKIDLQTEIRLDTLLNKLYEELKDNDGRLQSIQIRQQAMSDQIRERILLVQYRHTSFLIQEEYSRLQKEIPEVRILVVSQNDYKREVRRQMLSWSSHQKYIENDPL